MNLRNRIANLYDLAGRLVSSVPPSRWHAKPPGERQDPLPDDASDADRQAYADQRAMDFSVCGEAARKFWPE